MSIIIDHLCQVYEPGTSMEVVALNDICLQITDGEFIGLIGHTGSGKSTLIQHLNGILKPYSGSVYFDGADIFDEDYHLKKLRSQVGLVFQYPEHQLFEETVFKDVCFGPKNMGLSQKEGEMRAYQALKMVGLEDEYFYQSPFDLSGGQKRRVAIAGVLAMKPRVMILDEPTAGLDPKGRDEMFALITKLRRESNMSIVLVSHSMEDVAAYVERIVVMNQGKVMMDGSPHEVFSHVEQLEAVGLMAPQITYVMKRLKEEGLPVLGSEMTVAEAAESILKLLNR